MREGGGDSPAGYLYVETMPSSSSRLSSRRSGSPLVRPTAGRFRNRTLCAAATGVAASAIAEPASAAIIYDLAASVGTGAGFQANGTGSSHIDVISRGMMFQDLFLDSPNGMMGAENSTAELSVFSGGALPSDYLTVFNAGDTVDGSLTFADEGFLMEDNNLHPTWAPGETHYAGFQFDEGAGPLYGWLQIEFDVSGSDFTVLQWAYDDTGGGIEVGAVPEPGTALLLGLGLAGLGGWARRKRRAASTVDDA